MLNEHRKIGKELQLFDLKDHASGMVYWYPNGKYIYRKIEDYVRGMQDKYDYQEIESPIMASSSLWKKSGHMGKFKENMFLLDNNDQEYAIKPMSCPFHIEVFKSLVQSYNQLPLRLSEFGLCHRNEPSGALNGMLRLRSFNQDDGHIFAEEKHIEEELKNFVNMVYKMYAHFGFSKENIGVKISLRPENKVGDDELWDRSEEYLQQGLQDLGIPFDVLPGEGAFYGPKVEFSLKDSLDREWQCGTFQLDYVLAKRMNASYRNSENLKEYPVILHRAALGSIERFIAILLEHYDGKLPLWLNPNAISIIPVSEKHYSYAQKVSNKLKHLGYKVVLHDYDASMKYKVKQSYQLKSSEVIVLGDNEMQNGKVSLKNKKSMISMFEAIDLMT